ncbi:MAG: hypothetical protein BMS9Abin04_443 [Planctomycetia bacterium]|nr:MAG: hypothetical protein BMS9Abin04_443 [Planctomycetia bacterium]
MAEVEHEVAAKTTRPVRGRNPACDPARPGRDCVVVVPCYNEADRFDPTAFLRFVQRVPSIRFLLVNDGSTDTTRDVLERLCQANRQRFAVHHLDRNRGKAEAVRQGVLRALEESPSAVGFWDADLATPLDEIPFFLEQLDRRAGSLMVIGARIRLLGRSIERQPVRRWLGRAFATAASTLLGLRIYDTQCGAKLFRATPEVRLLFAKRFRTHWIFDVELLARLILLRRLHGGGPVDAAVYELPVSRWRDVAGSKVRSRDFFHAALELAVIYWTYLRRGARFQPAATGSGNTGSGKAGSGNRRAA